MNTEEQDALMWEWEEEQQRLDYFEAIRIVD